MSTGNRYALVERSEAVQVERYLPENYQVIGEVLERGHTATLIAGHDYAGFTLDDYIIPRLASGLRFCKELKADTY